MNEHRRYLTQEKMKDDKQQVRFFNNGMLEIPEQTEKVSYIRLFKIVYCPFCLHKDKLQSFIVSSHKKGISTYKAKCPECKQGMLLRTVDAISGMNNYRVQKYAEWCFMYRLSGFWSKIDMKVWGKRLKEYKWDITFWLKYRQLKGTLSYKEEDY